MKKVITFWEMMNKKTFSGWNALGIVLFVGAVIEVNYNPTSWPIQIIFFGTGLLLLFKEQINKMKIFEFTNGKIVTDTNKVWGIKIFGTGISYSKKITKGKEKE